VRRKMMTTKNARYYFDNREKYIEIIAGWSWKKTERPVCGNSMPSEKAHATSMLIA
jgi:hypothetical protein